jgi:hypothetical protein
VAVPGAAAVVDATGTSARRNRAGFGLSSLCALRERKDEEVECIARQPDVWMFHGSEAPKGRVFPASEVPQLRRQGWTQPIYLLEVKTPLTL